MFREVRTGIPNTSVVFGSVAQLVAHLHGMQGVRGSSPLRSTKTPGEWSFRLPPGVLSFGPASDGRYSSAMQTRIAGPLDVDAVTETIALAFRGDLVTLVSRAP